MSRYDIALDRPSAAPPPRPNAQGKPDTDEQPSGLAIDRVGTNRQHYRRSEAVDHYLLTYPVSVAGIEVCDHNAIIEVPAGRNTFDLERMAILQHMRDRWGLEGWSNGQRNENGVSIGGVTTRYVSPRRLELFRRFGF